MQAIPISMIMSDRERLIAEMDSAFEAAPSFGSITVSAHFVEGRLVRIEQGRSASVKADVRAGR